MVYALLENQGEHYKVGKLVSLRIAISLSHTSILCIFPLYSGRHTEHYQPKQNLYSQQFFFFFSEWKLVWLSPPRVWWSKPRPASAFIFTNVLMHRGLGKWTLSCGIMTTKCENWIRSLTGPGVALIRGPMCSTSMGINSPWLRVTQMLRRGELFNRRLVNVKFPDP